MQNQIIDHPTKSQLSETDDVRRGAAFLANVKINKYPTRFESEQDLAIAHRIKPSIEKARDYYLQQMQPPTDEQVAVSIEKLEGRGFQVDFGNEALKGEINIEWLEDLKEFPADLVELACKRWRRSNVNRAPYASGELMASVKSEFEKRKAVYHNAESVLKLIADNPVSIPKPKVVDTPMPNLKPKRVFRSQTQKCRPVNVQLAQLLGKGE